MTKLSEELAWRGLVNQTTYDDLSVLDDQKIALYFGVDPSGKGMQIGNLAAALMVRRFMDHGHRVFLLVGGATGMIGDTDGKLDERDLKAVEEIEQNNQEIVRQYGVVVAGKDFTVVDNHDWFKDM
ncbi:tyrosine--tRNA ligase, partial [Patescibacteria group bacterium]